MAEVESRPARLPALPAQLRGAPGRRAARPVHLQAALFERLHTGRARADIVNGAVRCETRIALDARPRRAPNRTTLSPNKGSKEPSLMATKPET